MSTKTINQHEAAGTYSACGNYQVLVEQKDLTGANEVHKRMLAGDLMAGMIASAYDTSTSYVTGDPCIYNGSFYICTGATSGNFDSSKWEVRVVATLSTTHAQNTTVHVTSSDKTSWNNAATAITTHVADTAVHVTSSEKTTWNGKADSSTDAEIETAWANA